MMVIARQHQSDRRERGKVNQDIALITCCDDEQDLSILDVYLHRQSVSSFIWGTAQPPP